MRRQVTPEEPDCLDEPWVPRPKAVIQSELRRLCQEIFAHDPERLAWLDEKFPIHIGQLELFK